MTFRKATREDVPQIVLLFADDKLGKTREDLNTPISKSYLEAFKIIDADKNQELMVVEDETLSIIGTFQLTFIQYLNYRGGLRAQIESVQIRKDKRGMGLGKLMLQWAINRAKERNACLIQLTSDKQRPRAIHFYKNLGFVASHEGMKLHLK
ncbi:GNAT family N-acetyltransferase [Tamlana fucoidanivorans]|uniref:GNAT family N-acetyltransferase n=1 Tax=Allotamlana fucoidanivorans TaxID=2583814 RepID=A0A5C4SM19_9FLAO|nr:GNAT family N-acetyltransferase [Tamlana fucoidanivorans]TNJ44719.1 GNAT family N-acetyltransferase [Tamlana fucoidanivorans]